jgi:hypothetical protein
MSKAKRTRDHATIRAWAEARNGRPALVRRAGDPDDANPLRIDFPDKEQAETEDELEELSWDEFFEKFDEKGFTFVYQDTTAAGAPSRFNEFVRR